MALTKLDPSIIGQDSSGAGKITSAGGSVSVDSAGATRIANSSTNTTIFAANGNVGMGTQTPNYSLDLGSKTDAMLLPSGTTAQRPTGTAGAIRFNTSLKGLDFYDGGQWNNINYSDPLYTSTKVLIKNGSLSDASNSRRTLTNGGGATKTSSVGFPGIIKGTSLTGSSGSVWYVDGNSTNAYVSFASPFTDFDMGQSAWTLEFWSYIPSGGSSYGHTFWCGGQSGQGEVKYSAGDGKFYIYSGVGQSIAVTSMTFNTWNWVVFERYNGTITTWVNGTRQAQSTTMPTGGTPSIAAIGYPFNSEYHGHYLDEVRWTTAARYLGAPSIPVQTTSWPEQ
jgi:Concanavalin A-like lectin/glucanases superfamily